MTNSSCEWLNRGDRPELGRAIRERRETKREGGNEGSRGWKKLGEQRNDGGGEEGDESHISLEYFIRV